MIGHINIKITRHFTPIVLVIHLIRQHRAIAYHPYPVDFIHQPFHFNRAIRLIRQIQIQNISPFIQGCISLEVFCRDTGTRIINRLLMLFRPTPELFQDSNLLFRNRTVLFWTNCFFVQRPNSFRIATCSSGIVPSSFGPMSSNRFPPMLRQSTKVRNKI